MSKKWKVTLAILYGLFLLVFGSSPLWKPAVREYYNPSTPVPTRTINSNATPYVSPSNESADQAYRDAVKGIEGPKHILHQRGMRQPGLWILILNEDNPWFIELNWDGLSQEWSTIHHDWSEIEIIENADYAKCLHPSTWTGDCMRYQYH